MSISLPSGGNIAVPVRDRLVLSIGWEPKTGSGLEVDASAFLVGANGRVPDDSFFVFYGAPTGPAGTVALMPAIAGDAQSFDVRLPAMQANIDSVEFCLTIHEGQERGFSFANLRSVWARLVDAASGVELVRYDLRLDGMKETAITLAKLYRRNGEWKLRAIGQGFVGGLAPLARNYGVDVAEEPAAAPKQPTLLEKRIISLEKEAPRLVSLAKKVVVSLDKHGLSKVQSRVGLVLDASGSMRGQYRDGRVQEVVDRIVPIGLGFDDDGAVDNWAFAKNAIELTPVTHRNCDAYVEREQGGWKRWMSLLEAGWNYEPAVIRAVMAKYRDSPLPTYILFISDGGVGNAKEIKKLLIEASTLPIFWQFVGIGGSNYGVLEDLDTMGGRVVDNCNFFKLDDLRDIDEQTLYDRMLAEYPLWLKAAREKRIIRD